MLITIFIALAIIILDQVSKAIIVENVTGEIEVIKDFFYIVYANNTGIAWGISVSKWILVIITIIALGVFGYFVYKYRDFKNNKWLNITLAFLIGGTIGNFIDRIFRSSGVVDFLGFILYYPDIMNNFVITTYDFPIFNVADSFLVVGSIMIIIYIIIIEPIKEKKKIKDNSNNGNNI